MREGPALSETRVGLRRDPAPEQNDIWSVRRSYYTTLETITALSDDPPVEAAIGPLDIVTASISYPASGDNKRGHVRHVQ